MKLRGNNEIKVILIVKSKDYVTSLALILASNKLSVGRLFCRFVAGILNLSFKAPFNANPLLHVLHHIKSLNTILTLKKGF